MEISLFSKHADYLRDASEGELAQEIRTPARLLLGSAHHSGKSISVAYAPFDHVNDKAEIVIVGLTPGRSQMQAAILEARRLLRSGHTPEEAAAGAKVHASFSGPMRRNLVAMLDHVGVASHLGLTSTDALWDRSSNRAHFTSALRYPVFVDGANYSGAPDLTRVPLLQDLLLRWFSAELRLLSKAIIIPLGPKVTQAVEFAAKDVGFDRHRVLGGIPHPSGANAERIAFFLGRKTRDRLSSKVAPDKIDSARNDIISRIRNLGVAA